MFFMNYILIFNCMESILFYHCIMLSLRNDPKNTRKKPCKESAVSILIILISTIIQQFNILISCQTRSCSSNWETSSNLHHPQQRRLFSKRYFFFAWPPPWWPPSRWPSSWLPCPSPWTCSQVRSVYHACMNEPLIEEIGLQPLKDKLKSMGGWPVLEVTISIQQISKEVFGFNNC